MSTRIFTEDLFPENKKIELKEDYLGTDYYDNVEKIHEHRKKELKIIVGLITVYFVIFLLAFLFVWNKF